MNVTSSDPAGSEAAVPAPRSERHLALGLLLLAALALVVWAAGGLTWLGDVPAEVAERTAGTGECSQHLCAEAGADPVPARWARFTATYLTQAAPAVALAALAGGIAAALVPIPRTRRELSGDAASTWELLGASVALPSAVAAAAFAFGPFVGGSRVLASAAALVLLTQAIQLLNARRAATSRPGADAENGSAGVQGERTELRWWSLTPGVTLAVFMLVLVLTVDSEPPGRFWLAAAVAVLAGAPLSYAADALSQHAPSAGAPAVRRARTPARSGPGWIETLTGSRRLALLGFARALTEVGVAVTAAATVTGLVAQITDLPVVPESLANTTAGVLLATGVGAIFGLPRRAEIGAVAGLMMLGLGAAPAAALLVTLSAPGVGRVIRDRSEMETPSLIAYTFGAWAIGALAGSAVLVIDTAW